MRQVLQVFLPCIFLTLALAMTDPDRSGPFTSWEVGNSSTLEEDFDRGVKYENCNCNCQHADCEFPKNTAACSKCASHGGKKSSFDEGRCWVLIGAMSSMKCGITCYGRYKGCNGFDSAQHYTYGNNCWCRYKSP